MRSRDGTATRTFARALAWIATTAALAVPLAPAGAEEPAPAAGPGGTYRIAYRTDAITLAGQGIRETTSLDALGKRTFEGFADTKTLPPEIVESLKALPERIAFEVSGRKLTIRNADNPSGAVRTGLYAVRKKTFVVSIDARKGMVGSCGATYANRINGSVTEAGSIDGNIVMNLAVSCPKGVTRLELAIPYTGARE